MRRIPFLLGLFLILSLPALAQESPSAPAAELYAGYAYGRLNTGLVTANDQQHNLNGWNAQVAANLNHWLGLVFDYSGYTGTPIVAGGPVDQRIQAFMGGPRVTWRGHGRWNPYVHTLFGATRIHAFAGGDSARITSFTMALGGGLDWQASQHWAFRLAQADYLFTRFPSVDANGKDLGASQHSVRIATGITCRFGRRD